MPCPEATELRHSCRHAACSGPDLQWRDFGTPPPTRDFAPHLRPGQSGPKRVSMPASIRAVWLVNFIIPFPRSGGQASIGFDRTSSDGLNPVPWTEHHGPRPTAEGPRDTPRPRLSCHAFGAASVVHCGSICRSRLRQPRQARTWPRPVSGARGGVVHGRWMYVHGPCNWLLLCHKRWI